MTETLDMPSIKKKVIQALDEAFEGAEPSGKVAILALELEDLTVVRRKLLDDLKWMVEQLADDPDIDANEVRVHLHKLKRGLREMSGINDGK
jgi:flagellar biosynthesis/type III secretory pathway protein FliH